MNLQRHIRMKKKMPTSLKAGRTLTGAQPHDLANSTTKLHRRLRQNSNLKNAAALCKKMDCFKVLSMEFLAGFGLILWLGKGLFFLLIFVTLLWLFLQLILLENSVFFSCFWSCFGADLGWVWGILGGVLELEFGVISARF